MLSSHYFKHVMLEYILLNTKNTAINQVTSFYTNDFVKGTVKILICATFQAFSKQILTRVNIKALRLNLLNKLNFHFP